MRCRAAAADTDRRVRRARSRGRRRAGGLTAALLLGRRGLPVLVLERHRAPYDLPRAVHLDDEVLRVLQDAGVADDLAALTHPLAGLRLVDAGRSMLAEFRRPSQ